MRLVQQQCTPVTVKFGDSSVADYFDAQVDSGRTPQQFGRIWVHTHPGNSPHPSCTDEDTFERCFGSTDWAVMLIVARGGQTYARLRFNTGPCGDLVLPVEIDFTEPFPAADPAAWNIEYRQMVAVEPDRPREPQLAQLVHDRRGWPDDYSPRFNDAWLESCPRDVYPDLPLELIDDGFH